MLKKLWEKKLVRFACVGAFNTLFDLSILNTLVFLFKAPPLLANLVSASISISASYFLNHHIVFRSRGKHTVVRFLHFFAVTGVGILAVQSLVIWVVMHFVGSRNIGVNSLITLVGFHALSTRFINLNIAKICAVLVAMAWNLIMYHFIVFKDKDEEIEEVIVAG